MKICTKCEKTKSLDQFYNAKNGLYGKMSWCKSCDSARRKRYNRDNKGKVLEQQRKWSRSNKEKNCEKSRRYRRKHPDKVSAYDKHYRENNPEKRAHWQRLRDARKKNATPIWADLDAILEIYESCPKGCEVDHIVPLKAMDGRKHIACGLHCEDNLMHLPQSANRRKWAKLTMPES